MRTCRNWRLASVAILLFAVNNKRRWKKGGGARKVIHNFFVFPFLNRRLIYRVTSGRRYLFVFVFFCFVLCFADDVVMFDRLPFYFIVSNTFNKITS